MKIMAMFFGGDAERDKETFFLALSLEIGRPKPLAQLRVRYGGKKSPAIPGAEPDTDFVMRFAELAVRSNISCKSQLDFKNLYTEYEQWYERHHPEVH
jgi:hypothetical protein